jgi:anti-sigma factor RsiW
MTCESTRLLLPLHVYGDLEGAEAEAVSRHVAECAQCHAEVQSIQRVRSAMDTSRLTSPEVIVSPSRIMQIDADRRTRSLRRWRSGALVTGAVAISALVALVVRPTVTVDDGSFVVRWSEPKQVPPRVNDLVMTRDRESAERIELLGKLVRALADESESRDRDRVQDIAALKLRLELLGVTTTAQMKETQRDMSVLYRAQFAKKEGD